MDDEDLQQILGRFETELSAGRHDEARGELRHLLFGLADSPIEGSVGDAVRLLAGMTHPPVKAAALVLRSLGENDLLQVNAANQLARYSVELAEKALPGFTNMLGVKGGSQNFEKFNVLCGSKNWVEAKLAPLVVPYATFESLLAARKQILAPLAHGRLLEFGGVYRLPEIRDAVEAVFASMEAVSKVAVTLAADVENAENVIDDALHLASASPSFVSTNYLAPFLACARARLAEFISSLRGRFTAIINQDWSGEELPKRYPLLEKGRDLRILVPCSSDGRGAATDVRVTVTSDSQHVFFINEEIALGSISPGRFSIGLDVHVVDPADEVSAMLEIEWGEVGTPRRQSTLFEIRVLAQATGIDWESYAFADPYGTSPAEGEDFVGRHEQVQTLVARMLRRPMDPSYVTGQKRVGKTSLAKGAAQAAKVRDPQGKLSWEYILLGEIAHEDPRVSLRQLGERIEEFVVGAFPGSTTLPRGSYDGSLSPLIRLANAAKAADPERRFVVIIDEFDEMPQELYLQGNLADTVFANIRALTTTGNLCLLLVGGENMPFVMDRQGQRLNKFSRVNLTYFDRSTEWDDYVRLVRHPSRTVLNWHEDAIVAVYDLTAGNPYFTNIICSKVFSRALRGRDIDITREEVREAVSAEISRLDDNLFAHLWQDGIFAPVDEREPIVLKRKRVLASIARCLRANVPTTIDNIFDRSSTTDLSRDEIRSVLVDFVSREVLVEADGQYNAVLPIFQLWLTDIGLTRLAADALSQNLAADVQRLEDEARVLSEELVALTSSWPLYRGHRVGPEEVRSWLNQRQSNRDQRALFNILKSTRFLTEIDILERIRGARLTVLGLVDAAVRRKQTDRRSDIVITYVDGEGKSGQRYAALYAEENYVSVNAILPPAAFAQAYQQHIKLFGPPKAIVIVDDIVATGNSLSENLRRFHDAHVEMLATDKPLILAFSLLATKQGQATMLRNLSKLDYNQIDFRAGEVLGDEAQIFVGEKGTFASADQRDRALAIATDVGATIYKRAPLGYGGLGLSIVFPTTVPNNSLPLLHSRGKGAGQQWRPLFERLTN
ncbi:ATP-binding protein [uncultured Sphingomonas sp.]|uniref:phosphoribosyltransferase-like protein n=1 Tax=uncultured Sphingomonas sp. TaxID=158754 RepID=UPI0025E24D6A|nr:ATP-binding protein [uncultured Sphingomonas sp.]